MQIANNSRNLNWFYLSSIHRRKQHLWKGSSMASAWSASL